MWYTWFWNTEHLLSGIKATCSAQLGTRPRQPQLPDVRKRTFRCSNAQRSVFHHRQYTHSMSEPVPTATGK